MCNRVECWERGVAKRVLERSLRVRVTESDLKALQDHYIETIASGGADASSGTVSHAASTPRI